MFKYFYTIICVMWLVSFYLYATNVIERKIVMIAFFVSTLAVFWVVWDILETNFMINFKSFKKYKSN